MSVFTVVSLRRGALLAAAALLAACSDQSSAPPANAGADPKAAPASQNATVAELLSGSDAPASTPPETSSPAPQSPQPESPQPAGDEGSSAPQAAGGDVEYARVVSVAPVTGPHRVCTNETVTQQRKPQDEHQVAGTVIGAIAGGVIGHQIGGGKGRTLATVGGAVGGGVVGKEIQKNQQSKDTVTRVVKHCRMVDDSTANAPVYDVVYAYQGQNFHVRLDHDPGDRLALPVRGVVE